jgi:hypothetical protein
MKNFQQLNRKEEVVLKVDYGSSSDEEVDIIDSSESDSQRVSEKQKLQKYKLPCKGVINQNRMAYNQPKA